MANLADAYMRGWQAGYHNATLAERKRILALLDTLERHHASSAWSPKYIRDLIERKSPEGKNEN